MNKDVSDETKIFRHNHGFKIANIATTSEYISTLVDVTVQFTKWFQCVVFRYRGWNVLCYFSNFKLLTECEIWD